jgi:mRNA-degrading endonuclease RelE of RelBE toxin-antitoxin system
MSVQLRMLEPTAKEIDKLSRSVKGAIYGFQRKFRQDLNSPGLRFKQLAGHSRLYSARVTDDYRAIMVAVSGTEFLLVAVKPWQSAYDNLERYAYQVNPVTGGIEFLDVVQVDQQDSSTRRSPSTLRVPHQPLPAADPRRSPSSPPTPRLSC